MIIIKNDGVNIIFTNYWDTEHGQSGLCYLSGNAGAWRLLVPQAAEVHLSEMRTGRWITIEKSIVEQAAWDIVFEDGTSSPFALTLSKGMTDRHMQARRCRMSVWTRNGKIMDLPCSITL